MAPWMRDTLSPVTSETMTGENNARSTRTSPPPMRVIGASWSGSTLAPTDGWNTLVSAVLISSCLMSRAERNGRASLRMAAAPVTIGVLALQGDFHLHRHTLDRLGVSSVEVRKPEELEGVAGLIMPGGESTTLLKIMNAWDFVPALEKFHASGRPIFGTCAGLILLARDVESPRQQSLGLIDITAERNAYGRQKESFETELMGDLGAGPRPLGRALRPGSLTAAGH